MVLAKVSWTDGDKFTASDLNTLGAAVNSKFEMPAAGLTAAQIADGAVGTSEIANASVAYVDLAPDVASTLATLTQTLTNKRVRPRVQTLDGATATTYAINTDLYDLVNIVNQVGNITAITTTGTPTDGQRLRVAITGTTIRTIVFSATSFEPSSYQNLPVTALTTRTEYDFIYNAVTSRWRFNDTNNYANIATLGNTQTLANKTVVPRIVTAASSATPTPTACDQYTLTAQAQALAVGSPGVAADGQQLRIRIKATGAFAITYNAIFRAVGVTLPTATVAAKPIYLTCVYNTQDATWDVIDVKQLA